MNRFDYTRAGSVAEAVQAGAGPQVAYLAGGTNLVDLMKENVERPAVIVDINRLELAQVEEIEGGGLRLGGLATNADTAYDARVGQRYPLLASAILAGASPQLRNAATNGGNLNQRTRCYYFYDVATACNKRAPGSGCGAIGGVNRIHAVLGASASCIATHPSDMCVALAALDATVRVTGPAGERTIPMADYHRLPGDDPARDTTLRPGELVTAIDLPAEDFQRPLHLPQAAGPAVLRLRPGVGGRRAADGGRRGRRCADCAGRRGPQALGPHVAWRDGNYQDEVAPPGSPFRALADAKIMFSGQPVAVVLAETFEAARYAASLVAVSYEAEPHNTNFEASLAEKFLPSKKRNTFHPPKSRGDAEAALAAAPLAISAEYHLATEHHNPMEMHATTVAWEGDGRITVHDKTQGSQNVQTYVSNIFGFAKDKVRVLNPYVGGGFGSGLRPQYQVYLAVMAAKLLERSVKLVLTRQQMFTHVHRPEATQTVRLGTDASGKLTGMSVSATTSTSRFENNMEDVVTWGLMGYDCPNAAGDYTIAPRDTYTSGDMRAPGAATGMALFEMAMDEMAYAANVDPLDFRLINYSDIDAMNGTPYTSKALREAYHEGAAAFGWAKRSMAARSMRDGSELVGWGMATGMWDAMFAKTSASAKLNANGHLEVATATSDIGTGTYTVMTLVAADTLGLAPEQITAKLGDSSLPHSPVEGGSWAAASAGAAVQLACQAVGKQLLKAAASVEGKPLGSASMEEVEFTGGRIVLRSDPAVGVGIVEAMRAAGLAMIEAEETASVGLSGAISQMRKSRHTHSAVFAEVKVDEELGVVRVTRIVSAVAAGRIINPKTARSQILGGVVMGIGMAMHEETFADHRIGRFMNHNFAEYHIPAHADIHDIEVIFVDEPDAEVTPLGVKGLGEIGIVGTAGAVANAIYHATRKRVRSLPITIDKLLTTEES